MRNVHISGLQENKKWEDKKIKTSIPSPVEQGELITSLNAKLGNGNSLSIACPIDKNWFQKWKNSTSNSSSSISQISNAKIINNGNISSTASRDSIEMITVEAYGKLLSWFGGDKPIIYPIRKESGKLAFKTDKIEVEVENNAEKKIIYLWERDQCSKFIKEVKLTFGIKSNFRIVLVNSDNSRIIIKDNDPVSILNRNAKQIFVDYMINDKWSSDIQNEAAKISKNIESKKEEKKEEKRREETKTNFMVPANAGKCGLINIGNTCYFNSGVQCLMHSLPLARQLLDTKWRADINETNPLGAKGHLVRAFARFNYRMWGSNDSAINPSDLKHILGDFAPQFQGYEQQDPHELIMFLLDGIHEDLNRCKNKPLVEAIVGDGTNDEETAAEAWKRHKLRNDSIIVDDFHGQLRSRCICPKCKSTTVVFDPFVAISLPIRPINEKVTSVLFIPYDLTKKHEWLRLKLQRETSVNDYEISVKETKRCEVVVAFIAHSFSSLTLYWDPLDAKYAENLVPVAFEVPEDDKNYCLCFISQIFKSDFSNMFSNQERTEEKPVMMPFLVQMDEETAEKEKITKYVSRRLKVLWNEEKIPKDCVFPDAMFTPHQLKRKNYMRFSSLNFEEKQRVRVKEYLKKEFVPSKNHEKICSQLFTAMINGNYMNSEHHFDLPVYLNNIGIDFRKPHKVDKDSGDVSLDDCFEFFRHEEVLDENNKWFCPKCREFVCANKKMDLWKASKCLIIHLKRFETTETGTEKDDRIVNFPEELDIKKYLVGPVENSTKYRLYAISEHFGSLGFGHCTAHATVPNGKGGRDWYSFNDSSVKKALQSNAHTNAAYVLFYEREDNEAEDNAVLVAKQPIGPQFNNKPQQNMNVNQYKHQQQQHSKYFNPNNKPALFGHSHGNKFDKFKSLKDFKKQKFHNKFNKHHRH